MKKHLLGLALVCSLSLMGMEQFGAPARVQNVNPTLKAILKRKYIDRQPLTTAQQAYLRKTGTRAIAAGLAALGIGAAAAASYFGHKQATKPSGQRFEEALKKYNIVITDPELKNTAQILATSAQPLPSLIDPDNNNDKYERLVNEYPKIREVIAEVRGIYLDQISQKTKQQYLQNIESPNPSDKITLIIGDLARDYFSGNTVRAQQFIEKEKPGLLEKKGLRQGTMYK